MMRILAVVLLSATLGCGLNNKNSLSDLKPFRLTEDCALISSALESVTKIYETPSLDGYRLERVYVEHTYSHDKIFSSEFQISNALEVSGYSTCSQRERTAISGTWPMTFFEGSQPAHTLSIEAEFTNHRDSQKRLTDLQTHLLDHQMPFNKYVQFLEAEGRLTWIGRHGQEIYLLVEEMAFDSHTTRWVAVYGHSTK